MCVCATRERLGSHEVERHRARPQDQWRIYEASRLGARTTNESALAVVWSLVRSQGVRLFVWYSLVAHQLAATRLAECATVREYQVAIHHITAHLLARCCRDGTGDDGGALVVSVSDCWCSRGSSHSSGGSSIAKISNKSSFGIIDIADDSSTTDRIIVIVKTVCFIHDGACRCRSGCHVNVSASH